jgi:hypothetical protein
VPKKQCGSVLMLWVDAREESLVFRRSTKSSRAARCARLEFPVRPSKKDAIFQPICPLCSLRKKAFLANFYPISKAFNSLKKTIKAPEAISKNRNRNFLPIQGDYTTIHSFLINSRLFYFLWCLITFQFIQVLFLLQSITPCIFL